jgi:hypothetical protein
MEEKLYETYVLFHYFIVISYKQVKHLHVYFNSTKS